MTSVAASHIRYRGRAPAIAVGRAPVAAVGRARLVAIGVAAVPRRVRRPRRRFAAARAARMDARRRRRVPLWGLIVLTGLCLAGPANPSPVWVDPPGEASHATPAEPLR